MKNTKEFETTPCLICGADNYETYSKKGQFNLETNVVICKKCGFSYLNPRWTTDRYNKFYTYEYDKYYREETVKNPDQDIEFKSIKDILERLKEKKLYPSSPANILDIGCGMGHSLIYMKERVFKESNYFAIEPSETCITHLKKNSIQVITNNVFSDWQIGNEKKFDFVIMRHVLEHFNEPIKVLKKVKSVLSDNGILFIAVPNSMKPTRPLKSHYFRVVHVSYFSPLSLKNAFCLSGLNPLEIVDGDSREQFEIYAVCNTTPNSELPVYKSGEWIKQKIVYDVVGKNDLYYSSKAKLVRALRKMKIIK